ncbi:MAG: hypothetical protein O3B21_16735 [Proteobacteria bacterium]|nr:hypothetical protein [Pseudomonadota bacterium]MDA1357966.1 hypothetical protein [Pseudomonadota bacterium]
MTRQLPLHRQSAHFELCVGGSMADCGYSAVLLFWRRMLLEMSGDQIQSAMRAAQLPRWCLSKNGNIHSDAVGVEDDKFN